MPSILIVNEINRLPTLGAAAASGDFFPVVDISSGTLKKVTKSNLVEGASVTAATIATATITTLDGTATRTPASLTGTAAITAAANANRVNIITGTTAATYTLPEATGSGNVYKFIIGEVNTNNTIFVTADTSNADMRGSANILDADANAQTAYPANASDDTMTLNGTTTGGQIGDVIEFIDIATDVWSVNAQLVVPTGSNVADPFSSAA